MTAAVLSAIFAVLSLSVGIAIYRRRLAGKGYEGTMRGVYTLGSVLGVLMGLGVGLATLSIVLALRTLR